MWKNIPTRISRLKGLNPRPDLKAFRAIYHWVRKNILKLKYMIQVVKLKNLKYSQISSTKESKLISNIENKNKNVTIVRHLVKYERFPEICSRKKPREKNECSGSDIEVIPCTSPLILPHWRTEGFDFSDIRKSSRWRNSIVLSRDSVGLTSKLTRKAR